MTETARLSKMLFEARELIDMWHDVVKNQSGREDSRSARVRDEIDTYRAEKGWFPDGFGGES